MSAKQLAVDKILGAHTLPQHSSSVVEKSMVSVMKMNIHTEKAWGHKVKESHTYCRYCCITSGI